MFQLFGRLGAKGDNREGARRVDAFDQARQAARRQPARWIPPGQPVEVAGARIQGGLIYVGSLLPAQHGEPENCLINPNLTVTWSNPDRSAADMPYWPSYSRITPSSRAGYLEWLAEGRSDPDIGIGHVFLFFYGLERRLFVDKAREEAQDIVDEVRRLLSIYGSNPSFCRYAVAFLEGACLLASEPAPLPPLSPNTSYQYELPLRFRIHLGRKLLCGAPISSDDALRWLLCSLKAPRRTPVSRCFDEFAALWDIRYQQQYPDGIPLRMPKTQLVWRYQSASGTFSLNVPLRIKGREIPDIAPLEAPVQKLSQLADSCLDELASYSRFLGRNPEARDTAEGATLLPQVLLSTSAKTALHRAAENIDQMFNDRRVASARFGALAAAAGMSEAGDRPTPARLAQLAGLLDEIGVGFEPDPRFGSTVPSDGGKLILFRARGGAHIDANAPDYVSMRTVIEVSALASAADGKMVPQEFAQVRRDIASAVHLTSAQRLRLLAYAGAIWDDVPKQRTVLNRLSTLPQDRRRQVLDSACATVLADGVIDPKEVTFLEKLAKMLKLDPSDIYQALHRGDIHTDEPVSIAEAIPEHGVPIPPKPEAKSPISVNDAKLEQIRRETAAVHRVLAGIFVDDEQQQVTAAIGTQEGTTDLFEGLDKPHSQLLEILLDRNGVTRAEFETIARNVNLLPDGALETINEWAFETFDEALFDDDEIIVPVEHLRRELLTFAPA